MEQTGYFERAPGNKSMARLLAFFAVMTGAVVVVWGMVLLTLAVNAVMAGNENAFQLVGPLSLVVSGGLALIGGGEALKVIQQRGEAKEATGVAK